jgi:hydrogenase nickel incorporation protein HypB
MFRSVDVVVVNKVDLLPFLDFDLDLFLENLRRVNPGAHIVQLSARTGDGVDAWVDWLVERAEGQAGRVEQEQEIS